MPAARIGILAATLAGNAYLVFGSLFFGSLGLLFSWVPPHGNWVFRCARWWSRGLLWASGVRLRVEREPGAVAASPHVFLANHQSLFDIPVLLATLPGQTRFLAKDNLFRIPVFGWALRAGGFVPIDRQNRSQARRAFAAALERAAAGASLLIFPEETRSRDGALLPFQRGGFLLAIKQRLPIVPVGIRGTLGVQVRGELWIRPGRVEVRYGAPIDVSGYEVSRKDELMAATRRRVAELAGISG